MNYSEFLFCDLLKGYAPSFKEMPLDDMWDKYKSFYTLYEESKYNDNDKNESDCMIDFIQSEMRKPITVDEYKSYQNSGISSRTVCPICKSDDIYSDNDIQESGGDFLYKDLRCNCCGEEWQERYMLTDLVGKTWATS